MAERVLSFEAALNEVLTHARSVPAACALETLPLGEALGRVLARPITTDRDQPPFDRSTRDGYAVRAADIAKDRGLRVLGMVRAGDRWNGPSLGTGEAVEIMTGTPLPQGADAVLMVEHTTSAGENSVQALPGRSLRQGENVVAQGAEALAGSTLLPPGRALDSAEIAVAAACGAAMLPVFGRPRVAIVATGDELVELDTAPAPWQIRNSNSYALEALVRADGGDPVRMAIARDTLDDLRARIAEARTNDLLVFTGGVSMGKHDLVEQALAEAGAEFIFTGAKIQPGKPIVFGRLRAANQTDEWTYFFGLPGNPVSTQVCFHLFVAPMLRALGGRAGIAPGFVEARLADDVKGGSQVTRFLPAELDGRWDGVTVRVVGWQGSGDVGANARGNAYAVLPADVEAFHAGETVRVLLR